MATEKVVLGVELQAAPAIASVKSLKSELKDLRNQLGTLEQGSDAFNQAAARAGQLQDKIRGVNDAIENADPEKKFAPFARTIQGLAGGFAAVQGAMGLFGNESKDLEKTLLKVQSAMALSQGLNSLLEFKNDFKDLGGMIINNVVKAFTTLRGAIIATGIGALAVTVGILITNWKEFSKAITNAFPAFKVVTDFFGNLRQVGAGTLDAMVKGFKVLGEVVTKIFKGDFSGAIDSAKTFGTEVAKAYNEGFAEEDRKIKIENGLKDRQFALDLEEAKGKDVKAKRVKLMKDELSLLEKGSEEYNAKLIEIEQLRTDIRKEADEKKKAEDLKLVNQKKANLTAELDVLKATGTRTVNELTAQQKIQKKILDIDLKNKLITNEQYNEGIKKLEIEKAKFIKEREKGTNESIKEAALEKQKNINETNQLIAKDELESAEERFKALDALNKQGLLSDKQTSDAKLAIAQKEKDAKILLLDAYAGALNTSAELVGKNTVEGKALAIAAATISTYTAIAKQLSAFAGVPVPGYAIVQAIATGVAGFAAIKGILDTPIPSKNGGGGGGGTAPTAPSIPRIPQSLSGSMLNQNKPMDINNTNPTGKVIVTETDITGTQDRVKGIVRKATIK